MTQKYQYITADGGLWRLTNTKYRKMLKMVQKGERWTIDLNVLGTYLGSTTSFTDVLNAFVPTHVL